MSHFEPTRAPSGTRDFRAIDTGGCMLRHDEEMLAYFMLCVYRTPYYCHWPASPSSEPELYSARYDFTL